jgi:lipoate---protein ligase
VTGWLVEHRRGPAADLHALQMPDDGRRRVWVLEATGPAVVLGSTQDLAVVDREAAAQGGVAVVRRRSGGGAVWVAPGEPRWVDVLVPRGDPLWDDDVGRAFLPVGRAWQRALARLGIDRTEVHEGPLLRTRWSDLVCFAGFGPGEVRCRGAKLVGISQRRTRAGARFQCAVPVEWDPTPLADLLVARPPTAELATVGTGTGPSIDTGQLVRALVEALTSPSLG